MTRCAQDLPHDCRAILRPIGRSKPLDPAATSHRVPLALARTAAAALVAMGCLGTATAGEAGGSVNVVTTLTVPLGNIQGTSVSIGPQVVLIPYDRQGPWEVRLQATVSQTLLEWFVLQGRVEGPGPLRIRADLTASPPLPLPPGLAWLPPGFSTGLELTLPVSGDPNLKYYTELRLGVGDDWYRTELPLFRYSWTTAEGTQTSLLGITLDQYAPAGSCTDAGSGLYRCRFTESWLTLSNPIPEPQRWTLLLAGLGLLGWRLRRGGCPASAAGLRR